MLKILLTIIFVIVFPVCIGNLWNINKRSIALKDIVNAYILGYFEMNAIFQLMCVPMCFMKTSFNLLCILYTIITAVITLIGLFFGILKIKFKMVVYNHPDFNLQKIEWIYIVLAVGFLVLQLYYAVFYSTTYMSYDDATYIVYANAAKYDNGMYLTNVTSGIAQPLDRQRALQSSIIFIAYLSKVTTVNVATIAHTVMPVQIILMAYATYYLMSLTILKKRDNRLIFLLLVEVLYVFGYYSHYSMTFRLLGPVWQGKAIFAILLTPYLFTVLPQIFGEDYSTRNGIMIAMLSVTASAMSLVGAGTMIIITAIVGILLTLFAYKKYKNMLYLAWGSALPVVYMIMYLILR